MLRRTVSRRFVGGFSSGFSKGFSGGSGAARGPSSAGFSVSSGFPGIFGGGNKGGSNSDGGSGPFSGFLDKALEWCSESHARDIAIQEGIDLRHIRFEKTATGGMNVIVDAPNATPLQIEQLGKRVQEECPVARFRKTQVQSPQQEMKWMRLTDRSDR